MDEPKGSPPPLPPSIAAAFDALTKDAPPAPPAAPAPARRPLLDIFPSESARSHPGRTRAGRPAIQPPARAAARTGRARTPADTPERFYGLREPPFAPSTDPRFFFRGRAHERVSQQLLTAIRNREGLVVITGAAGTGKTMVCRLVMEALDRRTLISLVADPYVTAEQLLTTILCDFGVLSRDDVARDPLASRLELSTTLQSFVESLSPLEATAVVIVDDAQHLPADVLEQIRLLCEAADATSLLQVVLVGQPELTAMLRRPECRTLHKRATVRGVLEPLAADEIDGYVRHRLAAAGDAACVTFDASAVARVFQYSRGVPRTIDQLCERALARGHEASSGVITDAMVEAAAAELGLESASPALRDLGRRIAIAAAFALFVAAGAAAAAWVFRDALTRTLQQWQGAPPPPEPARRAPVPLHPPAAPEPPR